MATSKAAQVPARDQKTMNPAMRFRMWFAQLMLGSKHFSPAGKRLYAYMKKRLKSVVRDADKVKVRIGKNLGNATATDQGRLLHLAIEAKVIADLMHRYKNMADSIK